MALLDIIIPVYNEGGNIIGTLRALAGALNTSARVLICYDRPDDDTLPAVQSQPDLIQRLGVEFVKNRGRGVHQAIMTGFAESSAPYILVYPADDDFNAGIIDAMVAKAKSAEYEIICASRFMPGGQMVGCPWLKATLVRIANFTLYHLAGVPTRDSTNGFRLFSQRTVKDIAIESDRGFCYSIELLVKVHRLGRNVGEVPAGWFERKQGESRFKVLTWLPSYLHWYFYAFATTYLRRGADTVPLRNAVQATS